jgi:hypothetical protein
MTAITGETLRMPVFIQDIIARFLNLFSAFATDLRTLIYTIRADDVPVLSFSEPSIDGSVALFTGKALEMVDFAIDFGVLVVDFLGALVAVLGYVCVAVTAKNIIICINCVLLLPNFVAATRTLNRISSCTHLTNNVIINQRIRPSDLLPTCSTFKAVHTKDLLPLHAI